MKTGIVKCMGLLIGLVFVLALLPQSAATVVWEDNFNDGNYDGWTVTEGTCDASSGYLVGVQNGDLRHKIWHPSSQVVGTWSFDAYPGHTVEGGTAGGTIYVEFMGNGTDRYVLELCPSDDHDAMDFTFKNNNYPLGYVEIEGGLDTWTHFDITRNSTGGVHVYVNATSSIAEPVLTASDSMYSFSDRFVVVFHYLEDAGFDNIVVDDKDLFPLPTVPVNTTSLTTSTSPPPDGSPIDSTLLIVGAGVAGIVIVAAVVFMRRR